MLFFQTNFDVLGFYAILLSVFILYFLSERHIAPEGRSIYPLSVNGYYCRVQLITNNSACYTKKIEIDIIKNVLLESIRYLHGLVAEHQKVADTLTSPAATNMLNKLQSMQKDIDRTNNYKLTLYDDYKDGKFTKDEYLNKRKSADEKIQDLTAQIGVNENY